MPTHTPWTGCARGRRGGVRFPTITDEPSIVTRARGNEHLSLPRRWTDLLFPSRGEGGTGALSENTTVSWRKCGRRASLRGWSPRAGVWVRVPPRPQEFWAIRLSRKPKWRKNRHARRQRHTGSELAGRKGYRPRPGRRQRLRRPRPLPRRDALGPGADPEEPGRLSEARIGGTGGRAGPRVGTPE